MNKNAPGALTLEQQFQLKMMTDQSKNLSLEQAQELVIELARQMMVKDNMYKEIIKGDFYV